MSDDEHDDSSEQRFDRAFIGEEFLTWLWWRCETEGGVFDVPHGGASVSVAIEDQLLLRGDSEHESEGQLRHGVPTRSAEAAAALAAGKRLARARLVLATPEKEWTVTLDGATLGCASASVPRPGAGDDPDLEAFLGFEDLGDAIDGLFESFLRVRLSPEFGRTVLPAMRRWIAEKAGDRGGTKRR